MAKYVRFENEEDLAYATNVFDKYIAKIKANPAQYDLDHVENVFRISDSLHSAADTAEASTLGVPAKALSQDVTEASTAKSHKVKKTPPRQEKSNFCEHHPYYQAKKVPRSDCSGCWAAYKKYNPLSYKLKRRDFERKQKAAG